MSTQNNASRVLGPVFKYPSRNPDGENGTAGKELSPEVLENIRKNGVLPPIKPAPDVVVETEVFMYEDIPVPQPKKNHFVRILVMILLVAGGAFAFVFYNAEKQRHIEAVKQPVASNPLPALEVTSQVEEVPVLEAQTQPGSQLAVNELPEQNWHMSKLFESKDYYGVIAEAKLKQCSTNELNMLGISLYSTKQYTEAINAFKQAETALPDEPVVKNNLGDALMAIGQANLALEKYRQALALNASNDVFKQRVAHAELVVNGLNKPAEKKALPTVVPVKYQQGEVREITPVRATVTIEAYSFLDLRRAVEKSDIAKVDLILGQGFDINKRDGSGQTLLIAAISNNDLNMVKHLIHKGADPNLPGLDGYSPIIRAKTASRPNAEIIQFLKTAGAFDQYASQK
jgi:tetratricopeptide (TPR) repeat protein